MKPFAYKTTSLAVKAIYNLSKAKLNLHGEELIPDAPSIFVVNHFTRIETFIMPYLISNLTKKPVWSLADYKLFEGAFGTFLENIGAVSTKNPDRDKLMIKTLLTGEASWIIFPEGLMVKDLKIVEKGKFMIYDAGGKRPPHTGAATLAMRSEFYRKRIFSLQESNPQEARRLMDMFLIDSIEDISPVDSNIVPVNISYYPIRAQENTLSKLASAMVDNIPERVIEELMTEGTMLLSGVDIDIRFGIPINISGCVSHGAIKSDVCSLSSFDFDDPIPSVRMMRKEAVSLMQKYMSSIYSMTTVNHDHLFASLLKKTPYRNLDHNFFKRRIFLIITELVSQKDLNLHNKLLDDQIHLLTDDRYEKYENFINIAVKTDVLKIEKGTFHLNNSMFYKKTDFHRVRIENPVPVMANAIEPLKPVQSIIRKYAWMPDFLVRKKLSSFLIKQENDCFEKDYREFYKAGESKDIEIGRPVFINTKPSSNGLLLIHGYMAAPEEVKLLGEYISNLGIKVYIPRLKGHGTSPEDLAIRPYTDWIKSVETGYGIVSSMCDNVIVGGFSTGAGLALELVSRLPEVKGVFAVNPPMKLQDFSSRFVPAVDTWNKIMKKIKISSAAKEFTVNVPENPHINYSRNPISGIRELEKLMEKLKSGLNKIECPALIAQGNNDPVVNPEGSREIYEQLGSGDKSYRLFDFDRHGIIRGEGSEKVYEVIGEFAVKVFE